MGKYKELIGSVVALFQVPGGTKDLNCHVIDNGDSSNTGRYIWGLPILIFYQATGILRTYIHISPLYLYGCVCGI